MREYLKKLYIEEVYESAMTPSTVEECEEKLKMLGEDGMIFTRNFATTFRKALEGKIEYLKTKDL